MKKLNALKQDIQKAFYEVQSIKKATFENNFYDRYLNRNWEFMRVNSNVLALTRYNDHIIFNEKKKHFIISNELKAMLLDVANNYDLKETSHVGLLDCLSPSILKRSILDDSSSTREINQKLILNK